MSARPEASTDRTAEITRSLLAAVWIVTLAGFGLWFLLAWGGHALVSDSAAWLFSLVDPWIASATWDQRVATLLGWGESLGTVAVWSVWTLGTVGLLLTAVFATWLHLRTQRAMAALR